MWVSTIHDRRIIRSMAFPTTSTQPPSPAPQAASPSAREMFWRWWKQQSPSTQDRYATLGPLVSVLLFLAAIVAAFWYLRNEEIEREQEAVKRDTEVVQQQIRLRLIENQEQLLRLAREISLRTVNPEQFMNQASDFVRARPEVLNVAWVNAAQQVRASQAGAVLSLDAQRGGLDLSQDRSVPMNAPRSCSGMCTWITRACMSLM